MRTFIVVGIALALLALPLAARADGKLEVYGRADLSADFAERGTDKIPSKYNNCAEDGTSNGGPNSGGFGTPGCSNSSPYTQISSNLSYLGFRYTQDLGDSGWQGLIQFESAVDVSATANIKDSLGSRDSYVGMGGPAGAFKIGKSDSPYKKSTASFDPFSSTVGDYNSIMGNTGGDNRAEFDWRFGHAAWWESPKWGGFSMQILAAPGQNRVKDMVNDQDTNSGFPQGDVVCNGAGPYGSGTIILGGNGDSKPAGFGCVDGAWGDVYSTAFNYQTGPVFLIAGYERHVGVNRHGDDLNSTNLVVGVHDEWAAKVGGQFKNNQTTVSAIYESMNRDRGHESSKMDERSRDGYYVSGVQRIMDGTDISAEWAHANATPGDPVADIKQQNYADLYGLGFRKYLASNFSLYAVLAEVVNNAGAHYVLGASGHGITIIGRDGSSRCASGDGCLPVDSKGVVMPTTIQSFSIGMTMTFSAPFGIKVSGS